MELFIFIIVGCVAGIVLTDIADTIEYRANR